MTPDSDDGMRPLPVEEYPDPVLEYDFEDKEPIVRAVNGTFRSVFDWSVDDEALPFFLERFRFEKRCSPAEFTSRVRRNEQFSVRLDAPEGTDMSYLVRVVPASDGTGGHVVFTSRDGSRARRPDDTPRSSVATIVSHDLRNPLDVAKARLRAGRETGEDAHFEHVQQAHERMERIIEDVLTAFREDGTVAVSRSDRIDFEDIAFEAWKTVETDEKRLTVEGPLPTAVADPDHVGRLFENLFRNAVEHGGETPSVRVGGLQSGTGFYVADDGPGIPERNRRVVFEPGYSSRDPGTGLGLAIVARIATAHGWTIRIEESSDGGARIEVRDVHSSESNDGL